MKKILLASTILVGTAGFAAADNANFTFKGKAYTGLAISFGWDEAVVGDINGDGVIEADAVMFTPEVSAQFTVGMMTTTDGGLEAGASITIEAADITIEDDHTEGAFGQRLWRSAASADGLTAEVGDIGQVRNASVYMSGDFGKFTAAIDGNNALTGKNEVDFTYEYSFGDFDVKAWYEYRFGTNNDEYGVQGTYNFGDYSVYAGIEYQEDIGVSGDWEAWAGGSASMNGFSGAAEAKYRNDTSEWRWKASASYTWDAITVGAFVEDDSNGPIADSTLDYGVNASYDLGGGVSVDGAYIYDNDTDLSVAKVGVSMSF